MSEFSKRNETLQREHPWLWAATVGGCFGMLMFLSSIVSGNTAGIFALALIGLISAAAMTLLLGIFLPKIRQKL
ncbi:MAG: hypothetical protein WD627_05380 [Actinomycetota bacterium]